MLLESWNLGLSVLDSLGLATVFHVAIQVSVCRCGPPTGILDLDRRDDLLGKLV